ncbi:hypothetical protein SAMN05421788_101703 [Filimonas lacunae]|uniref:Sensor of ECF-type sigma factor n=1 Tax=Filimonas lacunae TaxID=477680 RepID=A0A173MNN9_9BACT|nr:hypothetical protein [Filimonas lacunae]BAV09263.1 hypothetical protein FLA_5311 [Filimonas lacunae]SIS70036.1 hypothetical protein SAMN05421788_101703 [Filimonas lacunae]
MTKKLLFISLFLLSVFFGTAQPGKVNKTEAIRIAFITRQLNLTPQESQKFWPVYNVYIDELKQVRKSHDEVDDEILFEETILQVRKKYRVEFKKILADDGRVNRTFTVERSFREMLRKELENRKKARQQANRYQ